MPEQLTYATLERIRVARPVDRLDYITQRCRDRRILDIGCFDETAFEKHNTDHWLHGRIGAVARSVIGIDSSARIPDEGLKTGSNAYIHRGDGTNPVNPAIDDDAIDVIVAGEFIEHIDAPLAFLRTMKRRFPGRELLISTPNGPSFANGLLGTIGREAQHPDHIQIFSYKVLHTLCLRAGFEDWDILPYHFYATEMLLNSHGLQHAATRATEIFVRGVERLFPLLGFGYVVRARL